MRTINEAADGAFSLKELSAISSFKGRMDYCLRHLGYRWGSGTSRTIFDIDDEKVLKLAINGKGMAQNEAEEDASHMSDLVVRVYDFADDYSWVVEERCLPAKISDFQKVLGQSWEMVQRFVVTQYNQYGQVRGLYRQKLLNDEINRKLWNNEWFRDLGTYMDNYELPMGDLLRLSSWGLVERNGRPTMVILDAGMTNEVYNDYYNRKKLNEAIRRAVRRCLC